MLREINANHVLFGDELFASLNIVHTDSIRLKMFNDFYSNKLTVLINKFQLLLFDYLSIYVRCVALSYVCIWWQGVVG